jgi:hypothetical protein
MKLIIKFPNGDIVEINGNENAHQRLTEIQKEDNTVLLDCEIISHFPKKVYGHPQRVIDCLKEKYGAIPRTKKSFKTFIDPGLISAK